MSWDTAKDAARMMTVAVHGLEQLQKLTKLGGPNAEAALAAVDAGLTAIGEGFDGKTHPDVVAEQIKSTVDGFLSQDAQEDSDLDKKFPTG